MEIGKLVKVMPRCETCPKCGSSKLGRNQGSLVVEDDYIERKCNCGWHIKLNSEGEEI